MILDTGRRTQGKSKGLFININRGIVNRKMKASLTESPQWNGKANSLHPNEIVPLLREFHGAGGAGRESGC